MSIWSEQITLREDKTVSSKEDGLLLSHRGDWIGGTTIGVGRVGHDYDTAKELKVGEAFRFGPYTFGLFEIRLMEIGQDDEGDTAVCLITRLS